MPEFNPVLVKELRSRMRGPRAFILLTVYLGILGGAMLMLYQASSGQYTDLNAGRRIGRTLFYVVAIVALIEVCVITPLLTAGSIAGEKERETFDLLIASPLTPWQILWGKLASALAYALLLILAIVPLMSMAFLFGGVSLAQVLIALIGLVATAVFYACIGLFWSSSLRSSMAASSLSLGTVLVMLFGIPFLWAIFSLVTGPTSNLARNSPLLTYIGGAVLFSHPFVAMAVTESLISEGKGIWFAPLATSDGQIVMPSPWIAYVVLTLIYSLVLVLVSVRQLRPRTLASAPPPPEPPAAPVEVGAPS